jgi:hypothetical protein
MVTRNSGSNRNGRKKLGTDIHGTIEVQHDVYVTHGDVPWNRVAVLDAITPRHRVLFEFLFGAGLDRPSDGLFYGRGLPPDVDEDTRTALKEYVQLRHSGPYTTYATWSELVPLLAEIRYLLWRQKEHDFEQRGALAWEMVLCTCQTLAGLVGADRVRLVVAFDNV